MARRSNTVGKRFAKMKGLAPDEKIVMQRIARLMDAALNNRQPGNPYEPLHNKNNRVVYPVTNLTTQTGVKTIKLLWDAPPTDKHLRYSISITNKQTGETVVRSSFTNNYTYSGLGGDYRAVVTSVGRNGTASPVKSIDFSIAGDTITIEGNKNLPNELGTIVQDDIFLLSGQKIFVWGSLVLDAYQGVIDNNNVVLKLYYKEGDDATFDNNDPTKPLQLIEQITLFPATESASCLDDNALGQEISRPAFARAGSFETAQSVMFSPISVAESEEDKRYTFFLQATGRELNMDEVGLSLVLWAGSEGQADSIPEDPNAYPPAYTFPHYNSFHQGIRQWGTSGGSVVPYDVRWWNGDIADNYNMVGNQWTFACWFRPPTRNYKLQFDPAYEPGDDVTQPATAILFDRRIYKAGQTDKSWNRILITYETLQRQAGAPFNPAWRPLATWYHTLKVWVYNDEESGITSSPGVPDIIKAGYASLNYDEDSVPFDPVVGTGLGLSSLFSRNPYSNSMNNGWMFLVVCFEGSEETDANSIPKLRVYLNMSRRAWDDTTNYPPSIYGVPYLNRYEPQGIGDIYHHTLGMKRIDKLIDNQSVLYSTIYLNTIDQAALSTSPMLQNDRHHTVYHWGESFEPMFINGRYMGDQGYGTTTYTFGGVPYYPQPGVPETYLHQAGFWNIALDNWDGNSYVSPGDGIEALYYLYNSGRGTEIDWRVNSGPASELTTSNAPYLQGSPYIMANNLVHLWQFCQIEQAFSTGYPGRDTGFNLYNGDINMTGTILPMIGAASRPVGSTSNSWSADITMADILTPEGGNGTTQSDYAYPGQQMPDSSI